MKASVVIENRQGLGLTGKLLLLLLSFGVIPLTAVITVGYAVSRRVITEQAERALEELVIQQATHHATELARQRLLLRTIAGQLPSESRLRSERAAGIGRLLVQSLPERGVFDGLRLVADDGRVVASVALGNLAPHWPAPRPAGDRPPGIVVHREDQRVVAYVIAEPLGSGAGALWLEGHVRAEDFGRVFAVSSHLMGGVESAILEEGTGPVLVTHEHAVAGLAAVRPEPGDTVALARAEILGTPSLVAAAPVAGTRWVFAAALPIQAALAPVARLRDAAFLSAGVLVLLIVVTGVAAARSVTTPLRELAGAARRFGERKSYEPVPRRTSDEVGMLVDAFNRMAEDLKRSREEIDRLHAQELERAQQLATVGELASGVAHEIRNPLTGVLGALELALRTIPSGDPSRPLLEEAQAQLRRIEATTTQLLRFARPPEPREVVVDAHLVVERATRLVGPQAESGGLRLIVEPSSDGVPIRVDPELVVQVLVNLMLNGIEAMQPGGRLSVWVARHPPEVWIGVRDTGPGIPPEKRSEIFRPFHTTKHHGTGLGLSISRQIVSRHGGSLRVEDSPGGGATFVVALPLAGEGVARGQG